MDTLFWMAGIALAAMLSPGPNNTVVMALGARGGLRSAWPAITAIAITAMALVATARVIVGIFGSRVSVGMTIAGVVWLLWSAFRMWRAAGQSQPARSLPSRPPALVVFQFVNPKAWALALTLSAAAHDTGLATTALAPLLGAISLLCLTVWGMGGAAVAGLLSTARARAVFDRAMASLLFVSAISLLPGVWR